jgi:hypothetical protein
VTDGVEQFADGLIVGFHLGEEVIDQLHQLIADDGCAAQPDEGA